MNGQFPNSHADSNGSISENVQFYLTLNNILCTIFTVLAQCALCVLMSTHFNLHRRILKPLLLKARLDASAMMNAYIGTSPRPSSKKKNELDFIIFVAFFHELVI